MGGLWTPMELDAVGGLSSPPSPCSVIRVPTAPHEKLIDV